jgi:orotidine-5'-phosphate decarboxylase
MRTAATSSHPADRLLAAFDRIGAPICVGLDPVLERLPAELAPASGDDAARADAILRFSLGVLQAIAPFVGCVKFQSACYERYGEHGVRALHEASGVAHGRGFQVILDAKRGDIGVTAEHYAAAALRTRADWTTLSGYLGRDALDPFLAAGHGAFVLVRTSNPSGDAVQSLRLADGRTVAEAMADLVAGLGAERIGACGFSAVGAVVGATKVEDAAALRQRMPRQIFLVPGYGAQGGGVDDVLPCFRSDGRGAIVTASRSVLYPSTPPGTSWSAAIERAAERFHREIRAGLGDRAGAGGR